MTPCGGKLTLAMTLENNSSVTCLLVISTIHNLSWAAHDKVGYVDPPVFKDALRKQPHIISPPRVHVGPPASISGFLILGQRGVGVMSGIEHSSRLGEVWTNMAHTVQTRKETVGKAVQPVIF